MEELGVHSNADPLVFNSLLAVLIPSVSLAAIGCMRFSNTEKLGMQNESCLITPDDPSRLC